MSGSARRIPGQVRWGKAAVAALALAWVGASGCGARDDALGPGDLEPYVEPDGGEGVGAGSGSCASCDGTVDCGHCLVQAFDETLRCPPALPVPAVDCLNLNELHTDQYGVRYTCYYCP